MFQALVIPPNTDLFPFPASLAPLFVLDATFSLTQVEWKVRGRLGRTESLWGGGTVTSTFLALTWCCQGSKSGSTAWIMSWSVSAFLWFPSDLTPVPHSWELRLTGREVVRAACRRGGGGESQKGTSLGCRREYPNSYCWFTVGQVPGPRVDQGDRTVEPLPVPVN